MNTILNPTKQTLLEKLIQPLSGLIQKCNHKRDCKKLSDQQWLEAGLLRTLSQEPSGRAFLQNLFDMGRMLIKRSHFFETLKSKRRLGFCKEVNSLLFSELLQGYCQSDPLKNYSVLDGYDIYAGDGHHHAAATHDRKKEGKHYSTLHFYSLCLRTHGLKHLTVADTGGKRKREHDMHALKRLNINTLRQNAPKGKKVLYVWDRAGIDFLQWNRWKQGSGIYFISREKSNMSLMTIGKINFDSTDSVNQGVLDYEIMGCNCGTTINRIRYRCPLTGEKYNFLTNLSDISPGLIACLYKLRWDIEKVFDQVKNKMAEKKAWATSDTAKTMQAEFICLAHNLMLILEEHLKTEEGIEDKVDTTRRIKRLKKAIIEARIAESAVPCYLKQATRPTQRSVKFIRWLRNNIYNQSSWRAAVKTLCQIYAVF